MADSDDISPEGRAARFARWDEIGLDEVKADLLTGGHRLIGGPPAVRRLAREWVRLREGERDPAARSLSTPEWVRAADAVVMLKPIFTDHSAKIRICERAHGGLIRARARQYHFGDRVFHNQNLPRIFWWAKGHQALEQDWAAGDFSTWIENGSVHLKAFGVVFARADIEELLPVPTTDAKRETIALSDEDNEVIRRLDELVPSAALSYKQAILDLADEGRVSFRGPALELREALREILDHLAPDSDVTAEPGYRQETKRTGPTTKQKVRFIMKKKGNRSSSAAPEQAVTTLEEAIARLTRAVYERSSIATHVASERPSVAQLRRYVLAILHDIL